MQQRPIKKHEELLLQHLLQLINGCKRFTIPRTVSDLDNDGLQSIRLLANQQASYRRDLVEVKYLDEDNVLVLITLTESSTNELFELEFKKVYSNRLLRYPTPEKVKHLLQESGKPFLL